MQKISSKLKIGFVVFITLISFSFCTLSLYFLSGVNMNNSVVKTIGLLFGALGSFGFAFLMTLKELVLTKEALEIEYPFFPSKKIALNEILGYTEIEKRHNRSTYKYLTILTRQGNFTISSGLYTNYDFFSFTIAKKIKRDTITEKKWHQRQDRYYGIVSLVLGLIFFIGIGYSNFSNHNNFTIADILFWPIVSLCFIGYGVFSLLKK